MSKIYSKNPNAKELEIPFTMTPNFCLDTMAMRKPAENCVYFAIVRQTVGYMTIGRERKKSAPLSISRLVQLTGLSRQGVLNSRKSLFANGWILYKRGNGMTSYAIVDRYEEFKRIQESTELTEDSQLSRLDQSTELTEDSQLSRQIKEIEIKPLNKKKEKQIQPSYQEKEPEIELPKIKPLSEQLQELAEKNNIPYTDDVRQDNNFHSKLMLEIKNCTNEKILERANQFVSIAKRDKKPSWVLTNKLGFKTLKFKWDDIEMEYKAGKAHNAHPRPIKVKETLYDESRAGIVPTYEELQRMYSDV